LYVLVSTNAPGSMGPSTMGRYQTEIPGGINDTDKFFFRDARVHGAPGEPRSLRLRQ
jgi:hypothetical protein